eukprot:TRINITY_DN5240_c0_g1_i2.p1 TRINITY_DN5240_c0_g1~~TRINITY_DN5240_c0_g1_i2.p1  ORF type:complete len:316 (+),score=73.16 TRINITY_DN5240_c0_g1_i2:85-948(+)
MFGTSTPRSSSEAPRSFKSVSPSSLYDDSGVDFSLDDLSGGSSSSSSLVSYSRLSCKSVRGRYSWWVGKDRLDVLRVLCEMNLSHLLRLLGRYLGGKDLLSMSLVSKTWNTIVSTHYASNKMDYLLSVKSDSENSGYEEMRRQRNTPRKAMANVSNFVLGSGSSASSSSGLVSARRALHDSPGSPSKMRHRLFTEEASKLSPGECLQSCPRCTNPSRVIPSEFRATCSRMSCGFEFCTKCMCAAHIPGSDSSSPVCRTPTKSSSSSGRVSNKSIVSNKKSRRRLKRL